MYHVAWMWMCAVKVDVLEDEALKNEMKKPDTERDEPQIKWLFKMAFILWRNAVTGFSDGSVKEIMQQFPLFKDMKYVCVACLHICLYYNMCLRICRKWSTVCYWKSVGMHQIQKFWIGLDLDLTGSTKSTGYPARSGCGSSSPLKFNVLNSKFETTNLVSYKSVLLRVTKKN